MVNRGGLREQAKGRAPDTQQRLGEIAIVIAYDEPPPPTRPMPDRSDERDGRGPSAKRPADDHHPQALLDIALRERPRREMTATGTEPQTLDGGLRQTKTKRLRHEQ